MEVLQIFTGKLLEETWWKSIDGRTESRGLEENNQQVKDDFYISDEYSVVLPKCHSRNKHLFMAANIHTINFGNR